MSNTFIFNAYSTGTNFFHNQLNIMGSILLVASLDLLHSELSHTETTL